MLTASIFLVASIFRFNSLLILGTGFHIRINPVGLRMTHVPSTTISGFLNFIHLQRTTSIREQRFSIHFTSDLSVGHIQ